MFKCKIKNDLKELIANNIFKNYHRKTFLKFTKKKRKEKLDLPSSRDWGFFYQSTEGQLYINHAEWGPHFCGPMRQLLLGTFSVEYRHSDTVPMCLPHRVGSVRCPDLSCPLEIGSPALGIGHVPDPVLQATPGVAAVGPSVPPAPGDAGLAGLSPSRRLSSWQLAVLPREAQQPARAKRSLTSTLFSHTLLSSVSYDFRI